jgi:hypothetical protein
MGHAVGEILAFAVALAISPLHIIVIVLILLSARARANGSGYVIGRLIGLGLIVGGVIVVLSIIGAEHVAQPDQPPTGASIARIVFGILLLALAMRQWLTRPKPGAEPKPSALLRRVGDTTPARAFFLGLLMTILDPASLSLGFLTGLDIHAAQLPVTQTATVTIAFVLIATATNSGPLLLYFVGGAATERKLQSAKTWLMANEKTVMMVLFLILGTLLIGRGIRELAG